jgi:hypothetical protein
VELADAAAELGVPARILRAIEWDRGDLLADPVDADRIKREYAAYLGLDERPRPDETVAAPPPPRRVRRAVLLPLLAGLAPLLMIGLIYVLGEVVGDDEGSTSSEVELLPLVLVVLSSLLLAGAALPPGQPAATLARYRQSLALAGIGIAVAVAVFMLLSTLT